MYFTSLKKQLVNEANKLLNSDLGKAELEAAHLEHPRSIVLNAETHLKTIMDSIAHDQGHIKMGSLVGSLYNILDAVCLASL